MKVRCPLVLIEWEDRRPFTRNGFQKEWRRALTAAGVEDGRFHDLRHTAGTRITRTTGLLNAKALLGHAKIESTTRYAHVSMDDKARATEAATSRNSPEPTARMPPRS